MSDYTYWQNALAGKFGPMHGNDPQPGFYKRRFGSKAKGEQHTWAIVAIWRDGENLVAWQDGKPVDAEDVWTYCCQAPITEELYRRVERGEGWPDAIETMIGDNNPPTDEAATDEIQSAINAALAALDKPIEKQEDCDRIANHADRLGKLWKAQEGERKENKRPHQEAADAVDEQYQPVLAKIKEAGTKLKGAITAWLLKEEQRKRKEISEKLAAEEAARKAAVEAGKPLPEPAPIAEITRPKAGTTGRSTALRTYKSAVITDYTKALAHFSESNEVKELIQTMADRCARADIAIPGCEIKTDRRAA